MNMLGATKARTSAEASQHVVLATEWTSAMHRRTHLMVESLLTAPLRAQVVTDEMWAARAARWPDQPPATREYFLLRSMFEEHFPSPSALATVPTVGPPLATSIVEVCFSLVENQSNQSNLVPSFT